MPGTSTHWVATRPTAIRGSTSNDDLGRGRVGGGRRRTRTPRRSRGAHCFRSRLDPRSIRLPGGEQWSRTTHANVPAVFKAASSPARSALLGGSGRTRTSRRPRGARRLPSELRPRRIPLPRPNSCTRARAVLAVSPEGLEPSYAGRRAGSQPAVYSIFTTVTWYRRSDSNGHCARSERAASASWATSACARREYDRLASSQASRPRPNRRRRGM